MAEVTIGRQWSDGDSLLITVEADDTYPDALDETRAVALKLYAEALGITITTEADDRDT